MLKNYIKVAFKNIARNKLYAMINILGLAMGLSIYVFGGLLYDYEHSHDTFFKNSSNTYTLESVFSPESNNGGGKTNIVHSAVAPIIKTEISQIEAIARTKIRNYLFTIDDESYFDFLHFSDPELLQIFDFDYVYGDASALENTTGMIITENIANKFFGDQNPIGRTISINHENDFQVTAVIKNLPLNTHFRSNFTLNKPLEIIVPIQAMSILTTENPDTNWNELSTGNITYVLLPEALDGDWLQSQLDGVYERHYPDGPRRYISGLSVRNLVEVNTAVWDEIGIPAIDVIRILGFAVLFIACLNYTNLATAQSLGRAREVGLRKTLGATPAQLLVQFIVESLSLTAVAMILALSVLELLIPLFNSATGKILTVEYLEIITWLSMTTITVGVLAGSYPAFLITRINPINALKENATKGKPAASIRTLMISAQFTISVFMLALVLVVNSQNEKVEEGSNIYPKSLIYTLERIGIDQIEARQETLKEEMLKIPGVENFAYSSQVPYENFRTSFIASNVLADLSSGFRLSQMITDDQFLDTFDIQLIAGRKLNPEIAMDTHIRSRGAVNVLINELAVNNFGFGSPQSAIGESFYEDEGERGITTYTVVGVFENQNIYGLQNRVMPFVSFMREGSYRHASLKLSENYTPDTLSAIENTWKRVIPDYPLQAKFLESRFDEQFSLFSLSSRSLASFAIFALFLALIGLFGLAAFMAEQRTKEIGIRKVLGANTIQIVRLLIWQFSKPVFWAAPIALTLAYFASNEYLQYFADRIQMPFVILIGSGVTGVMLSWATVATHAFRVAKANPIHSLRHE